MTKPSTDPAALYIEYYEGAALHVQIVQMDIVGIVMPGNVCHGHTLVRETAKACIDWSLGRGDLPAGYSDLRPRSAQPPAFAEDAPAAPARPPAPEPLLPAPAPVAAPEPPPAPRPAAPAAPAAAAKPARGGRQKKSDPVTHENQAGLF